MQITKCIVRFTSASQKTVFLIGYPYPNADLSTLDNRQSTGRFQFWLAHVNLSILTFRKMWDFNFPRGLAPGLLDGFSIGRCERNTESFGLSAASFDSGAIRFSGGKSLRRWSRSKKWFHHPCLSIKRNSKQRTQNPSKRLKIPLLMQKDHNLQYVNQHNVYLALIYAHI